MSNKTYDRLKWLAMIFYRLWEHYILRWLASGDFPTENSWWEPSRQLTRFSV